MKRYIRILSLVLIPAFVAYTMLTLVAPATAYASSEKITKFSPDAIEADPITEAKSGGSSWWKWALGILVVGGIAAAAGGHGSGGGGGNNGSSGGGTTTVNTSW